MSHFLRWTPLCILILSACTPSLHASGLKNTVLAEHQHWVMRIDPQAGERVKMPIEMSVPMVAETKADRLSFEGEPQPNILGYTADYFEYGVQEKKNPYLLAGHMQLLGKTTTLHMCVVRTPKPVLNVPQPGFYWTGTNPEDPQRDQSLKKYVVSGDLSSGRSCSMTRTK